MDSARRKVKRKTDRGPRPVVWWPVADRFRSWPGAPPTIADEGSDGSNNESRNLCLLRIGQSCDNYFLGLVRFCVHLSLHEFGNNCESLFRTRAGPEPDTSHFFIVVIHFTKSDPGGPGAGPGPILPVGASFHKSDPGGPGRRTREFRVRFWDFTSIPWDYNILLYYKRECRRRPAIWRAGTPSSLFRILRGAANPRPTSPSPPGPPTPPGPLA